ncbi:MAG: hypothetical protein AABY18_01405 [Candidatus Thermoplasmatota archaeon]
MRLPAFVACAALFALPGCIGGLEAAFNDNLDCSSHTVTRVNESATILYPAMATSDPSPAQNPSATGKARAGQTLSAMVVWSEAGGNVHINLDGPRGNVTQVSSGGMNVWNSQATAPAGNFTLTLEGDPFAFSVNYSIILQAFGCTSK